MKKNIITFIMSAFITTVFFAVQSYAQTAQQKANEIKNAGQAAEQTQSATESRDINNAAWDGAKQGNGGTPEGKNGTIDIIDGNTQDERTEEKPSTFEKLDPEDVTPWKTEYNVMFYAFVSSITLLFFAGIMAAHSSFTGKIATGMGAVAAAGMSTALAMAIIIMNKYGQSTIGEMWIALSSIGLAMCAAVLYGGIESIKNGDFAMHIHSTFTRYLIYITMVMTAASVIGMSYIKEKTDDITKEYQKEQICPVDPGHDICIDSDDNRLIY